MKPKYFWQPQILKCAWTHGGQCRLPARPENTIAYGPKNNRITNHYCEIHFGVVANSMEKPNSYNSNKWQRQQPHYNPKTPTPTPPKKVWPQPNQKRHNPKKMPDITWQQLLDKTNKKEAKK